MRKLLLEVGAHAATPQQAVVRLLGDARALTPLGGPDGEGWVPDLGADAWQDVELLK